MSDHSLRQQSHPVQREEEFSFEISIEEITELEQRSLQLIGEEPSWHCVQLELRPGQQHRWFYVENNVTGWFISSVIEKELNRVLTLPLAPLVSITEVFAEEDTVSVTVNTQGKHVEIVGGDYSVSFPFPTQLDPPELYLEETGDTVIVSASDLAKIGRVAMVTAQSIEEKHLTLAPLPFVEMFAEEGQLIARRDWCNFGGGMVSVAVPAVGGWGKILQVFPTPISTEFYLQDLAGDCEISMSVLHHCPNILRIDAPTWGYFVELQSEKVYQYRRFLAAAALSHGYDTDDEYVEDQNHLLNIFVNEDMVSVFVIPGENCASDYLRAELTVTYDIERTELIAHEINSWNNSLGEIKVLQQNKQVIIRYETPASQSDSLVEQLALLQKTAEDFRNILGVFI